MPKFKVRGTVIALRKATVFLLTMAIFSSALFLIAYRHRKIACPLDSWIGAPEPDYGTPDAPNPLAYASTGCTTNDIDYMGKEYLPLAAVIFWVIGLYRARNEWLKYGMIGGRGVRKGNQARRKRPPKRP